MRFFLITLFASSFPHLTVGHPLPPPYCVLLLQYENKKEVEATKPVAKSNAFLEKVKSERMDHRCVVPVVGQGFQKAVEGYREKQALE